MGSQSRQQREARRRSMGRSPGPDDVRTLIDVAAKFASAAPGGLGPRIARLNELGSAATADSGDPAALVVDEVFARIAAAWESGWQPRDLVHTAGRRGSKPAARWTARAVLLEPSGGSSADTAPREWTDQLDALREQHGESVGVDDLLARGGRAGVQQWVSALVTLDLLRILPASQLLSAPPSRWGRQRPAPAQASSPQHGEQRAKMLSKVRSLLAKAESTEFAAEAEAFTAKAQDLMTRHSIDEALLTADAGEVFDVRGIRVLIDQPYALEKATLLHAVAEANRVTAIWSEFSSSVTLIGLPIDVEQVDLLFTSTLVQATRAMTRAEASGTGFRRAFLQAFATRIAERLSSSAHEAADSYGAVLVPVLRRQAEAVADEVERLFPHVTTGSRRRRFDARGWEAGTRAADAAVLPAGAVESGPR
ncbi:DUF2786 domain-containing protein [Aeromicrobium endophyticum]|nr:DUF2786 domain-containing protein [Aeromicrobium endophyticum]